MAKIRFWTESRARVSYLIGRNLIAAKKAQNIMIGTARMATCGHGFGSTSHRNMGICNPRIGPKIWLIRNMRMRRSDRTSPRNRSGMNQSISPSSDDWNLCMKNICRPPNKGPAH